MKQFFNLLLKPLLFSLFGLAICLSSTAQKGSKIDWSKDTISSTTANNAQRNFANALNGTGKKASTVVRLPVDKLKEIMDACYANGIDMVKVMIVSIRAEDVAQYAKNNPGLSDADKTEIVGKQLLVFRVPRKAFAGPSGSGIRVSNSSMMIGLLAAGFIQLPDNFAGLGAGDDIFFSFGNICPPPNSCD